MAVAIQFPGNNPSSQQDHPFFSRRAAGVGAPPSLTGLCCCRLQTTEAHLAPVYFRRLPAQFPAAPSSQNHSKLPHLPPQPVCVPADRDEEIQSLLPA